MKNKQLKTLKDRLWLGADQDYSLNPGCYVGVVIEDDDSEKREKTRCQKKLTRA